ncbi:MAG: hypothetical protein AAF998_17500 [Bacteroidota bacterium]
MDTERKTATVQIAFTKLLMPLVTLTFYAVDGSAQDNGTINADVLQRFWDDLTAKNSGSFPAMVANGEIADYADFLVLMPEDRSSKQIEDGEFRIISEGKTAPGAAGLPGWLHQSVFFAPAGKPNQ